MVCKAYVESKVGKYKVKVRIPALHRQVDSIGAVPTVDIPQSTICVSPGVYPSLRVGDCLWVDFEDDNIDKPVVMGILYTENTMSIKSDFSGESLEIKSNATLPTETSIGKVSSKVITYLIGLKKNAQDQFDNLVNRCIELGKRILKIETNGCGEGGQIITIISGELDVYVEQLMKNFNDNNF